MFASASTTAPGVFLTIGVLTPPSLTFGYLDSITEEFTETIGTDLLSIEHLLYIAALLIGILVLIVAYHGIKRYLRTPGEVFRGVVADYGAITILMHPNPDPDAMAAALGVAAIADSVDTDSDIQYTGQIRHQENRAFRTVLGMDCDQIETASEITHRDAVVLVDHNTPRGFTEAEKIEPIAVVDHHPGNGTGSEFTDVRDEYGSTATTVTEYLTELGAELEHHVEGDHNDSGIVITPELATGLLYGIQSDTNQLTQGCIQPDFDACSNLFPGIDEDKLNRIANPQVSHDVLKVKARAITDIMIDGSFGVCNVGDVENVDSLSQAGDELMRLEGVTAVIVYAKNNGTLHISGRSRDDRVHMGESLQQAVSDVDLASAGGHARMGGGQIPINHLTEFGSVDGVNFEEFNDRLFAAMNGDH